MFSYEDRNRAIQLLIKYNMAYARVRKELGYPSKTTLFNWYKEYKENSRLHENYVKRLKYSEKERQRAVDHYLEHGKNISNTVKALGYPCRGKGRACLLVLAERKSREALIFKLRSQTQKEVQKRLDQIEKKIGIRRFRSKFKSITVDNGSEFLDWRSMEQSCVSRQKNSPLGENHY